MNKTSSMKYWYPLVAKLAIPQPKTELVDIGSEMLISILDQEMTKDEYDKIVSGIKDAISRVGGCPAFMRTDLMSSKHSWKDTCFLSDEDDVGSHFYRLVEENFAGFTRERPSGIYVREFIPLFSTFTAFWGDLPVSKERRYFVRDGGVVCHHPYWPQEAIRKPSIENWEEALEVLNKEDAREVDLLTDYSSLVSENVNGYWSVDYAMREDGTWYLIDMALGEESWHPDCSKK